MDFEKPLDCRKIRQGKNLMFGCGTSFLDLEKTLEINGIQYVIEQPKEEIKEESKQELYVIWSGNGAFPQMYNSQNQGLNQKEYLIINVKNEFDIIHRTNSLKEAEEEVKYLLKNLLTEDTWILKNLWIAERLDKVKI